MHERYGTITPAIAAFAISGLLCSAQTLAQNAYIPGQLDNTVSVISTATNTVTTVIHDPSFNYPFPVAVTLDGSKVYVANYGLDHPPYSVSVISTATNTATAVINDPSFNMPDGIAVTPDGRKVYIANCVGDSVSVIHTATNTVTTIKDPSFSEAVGVAVTPDGRTVYISNYAGNMGGNTVSVIDIATDTVTKVIHDPSFNFPWGEAVTPDGRKVYDVNGHSDNVSVISTATNMVVGSPIPVGKFPAAGGVFIQPRFAGTPGKANCFGQSVSALARTFGGFSSAAAVLGFPKVSGLQNAILEFCGGYELGPGG